MSKGTGSDDEKRDTMKAPPIDEAEEARLDAEAEADYAAGRVVSHECMCEWLAKLAKGERVPAPET